MNFNKVIIGGHVTRIPDLRYTPKGTAVARVSVAVNRSWKNEAGETMEEVAFIDCDAWGRTAEVIAQYFDKGAPILIEGRLKLEVWNDKNDKPQQRLKVVIESFSFVASKPGGARKSPTPRDTAGVTRPGVVTAAESPEEDDVPF